MRSLVLAVPAATLIACAAVSSTPVVTVPGPAGESVPLPSEWCGRHILVHARVSGDADRPLVLLLDTGSTHSVLDPASLERIGGGTLAPGKTARIRDLRLDDVRVADVDFWVQELDHLGRTLGTPIDGLLGYPVFRDVTLTLDYPGRQVRVASGEPAVAAADDLQLRLAPGRRRPWVELRIGDETVLMLIDSGSSQGFTLPADRPRRVEWQHEPVVTGALVGFRHVEPVETGRLAGDVTVATVHFRSPAIRRVPAGEIPTVGASVLERFVLTLDGPRGVARFLPAAPGEGPLAPEPLRGLGVGWRPLADALEAAVIVPGGPADAAGLREGDRVIAVDGRPVPDAIDCDRRLGDAERVELRVRRGEEELRITLGRGVLLP